MDGEGKRHQMMQNLFGDQSEEEEEEEIDSEHESNRDPNYISDDGEGEADFEGEGETDVHRHEEVEIESEVEMHEVDSYHEESGGERVHSSQEKELSDQRIESEDKEADSDDREGESEEKEAESEEKEAESEEKEAESEEEEYEQRAVVSRREIIASGSERWDDNHYADNEDEEVAQSRTSRSPGIQKDHARVLPPVTEIHDVFGESDEDEPADYAAGNDLEHDSHRSLMDEEGSYENDLRPEDIVPDQDAQSESEDETLEQKHKEKPMGPPLELDIPLCHPLGPLEKMNMIKVSNIMGIEPKPFDPKTYVEEDVFVTDESGGKKRIRLEDNIVRWRKIRNRDGTMSYESNARFVRWSDGSLQLLIGNEVLNISVQEAQHDQTHLFLRHAKGILQSQGRLLRKMRFMPSSLSSKSHRLLTALVDSRHKKVYKVQKCITEIDPEREKEEKEKAEGQTIRANELLNRKREKVSRKYAPPVDRGRQLSPGFLEDALEENDEHEDYYESRHSSARRRFEEDLEVEALSEKRILNAKRSRVPKDIPRKSFLPPVRPKRPIEFSGSEKEESEYESDEGERSPIHKQVEDPDEEYEEAYEHEAREGVSEEGSEGDDSEEPNSQKEPPVGNLKRKEIESDEDSPPRKPPAHRRMAVVYDSDEE